MYRLCNITLNNAGESTVIHQQWLVMQKFNRQDHPHNAAIIDIIKDINKREE